MTQLIVVLESQEDAAGFEQALQAEGIPNTHLEGLPRFFLVDGYAPDTFPLKDHPAIEVLEDGDERVFHPNTQEVVVSTDSDIAVGGWAPARIIRRNSPWLRNLSQPPRSFFRSRRTGEGVDIYILDTGVDCTHPEFGGRANQPYSSSVSMDVGTDDYGHGTGCAGCAGGGTNGIARDSRITGIKFTDTIRASRTEMVSGLSATMYIQRYYDGANRPAVMSFSWSGYSGGRAYQSAINDLISSGVVCVLPAMNGKDNLDRIEAGLAEADPDAIICAGSTIWDTPFLFTGYGFSTDIISPSTDILLAAAPVDGGGYRISSGTSYGTPYTAGVIACMLEGYERPTSREQVRAVKAKLLENATQGAMNYSGSHVLGGYGTPQINDRLLYLDPDAPIEYIPGLVLRRA